MKTVSKKQFVKALKFNQANNINIKQATTPYTDIEADKTERTYYLNSNNSQGFALDDTGELTSLYSTIKGEGSNLLKIAISKGALHLDCFDGFLTKFYSKQGFTEFKREPNWTKGEPDIIYMKLNNKLNNNLNNNR